MHGVLVSVVQLPSLVLLQMLYPEQVRAAGRGALCKAAQAALLCSCTDNTSAVSSAMLVVHSRTEVASRHEVAS